MKVILKQDVKKLGTKGSVVNVSDGYARNFLFPRKLAIPYTESSKKSLEAEKKDQERRNRRILEHAKEKAKKLESSVLTIKAKSGEEGKLFGSVTTQDLSDTIKQQLGFDIPKKDIKLKEHIKYLGKYTAEVKLHPKVKTKINFEVVKE